MSSERIAAGGRPGVDWRRAEFVLTLLAFLGFVTLPIRITTIYSGLPAHPLFVHVPVVLIPTTIVVAIVFVSKREWLSRYGIVASVWFSSWTDTPSFASTAWCRPSDQRLPSRMRPVNSSMILTSPSITA